MVQEYSDEAWIPHIPQLEKEFRPCLFDGVVLIQDCGAKDPSVTDLQWLRKKVVSLFPNGGHAVDFGCGIGLFSDLFSGLDYTGVDLTPAMVQAAQRYNPGKKFLRGGKDNLTDLFPLGVDLIFTRAVIQHNLEPVKSQILQTFYDVLRPGGYYLFHEHSFMQVGNSAEEQALLIPEYMSGKGFELVDKKEPFIFLFRKSDRD